MTDRIKSATFRCGERIFSEGEAGHLTYIVRQGFVRLSRSEDGGPRLIAEIGPGHIIGEMAVISEAPRSATAIALTDCMLSVIPRLEIDRLLEEADPILKLLLLTAFERIRQHAAPLPARRPAVRPLETSATS